MKTSKLTNALAFSLLLTAASQVSAMEQFSGIQPVTEVVVATPGMIKNVAEAAKDAGQVAVTFVAAHPKEAVYATFIALGAYSIYSKIFNKPAKQAVVIEETPVVEAPVEQAIEEAPVAKLSKEAVRKVQFAKDLTEAVAKVKEVTQPARDQKQAAEHAQAEQARAQAVAQEQAAQALKQAKTTLIAFLNNKNVAQRAQALELAASLQVAGLVNAYYAQVDLLKTSTAAITKYKANEAANAKLAEIRQALGL